MSINPDDSESINAKDIERQFRVRLNEPVNDLLDNKDVKSNDFGQLLYGGREIFYQLYETKDYKPLTLACAASDSKIKSLAFEVLNTDIHKGDIIQIRRSEYSFDLSYAAVIRRTTQGLDDIGLLMQDFKSEQN